MVRALTAAVFCVAASAWALSPTAETQKAFDKYAAQAEEQMRKGAFLYADTHADARAEARKSQTFVVETRSGDGEIPEGAVHDWLGVSFFPGVKIAQVRALLEDYANYKQVYAPEISDSRTVSGKGDRFHIFLRMENKQFLTLHYNSEYDVEYKAPGAGKLEVVSRSTKMAQDGDDYGFLWRLNSYWRFEEADGGVYAECRSISLSRGMPAALGWLRGAIEKFPRDTLVRTMDATRRAAAQH